MRALYIARRVVTELIRDKRTLALMFVAPVLIMFLMKLIFTQSASTSVKVATVDLNNNVRTTLNDIKHVAVSKKASNASAQQALRDQKVDAVIHETSASHYTITYANTDATKTSLVKAGFNAALTQNGMKTLKQTTVKLSRTVSQMAATIARLSPQAAAAMKQPKAKAQPRAKIKSRYNYGDKNTDFFDKIVPILMGFFVFFFVFLISGMALLKERTTGTLDRLLATPVRRGEIVLGYMISYGILALIQTVIIVLTTVGFMGVEITGSLGAVMVINFLLALVALAFGILLSTLAQSEFQMMQFIPIIVIPQIFFSGIVSLDSLASWVKDISYVLPLTYAGNAMTQIIMDGTKLTSLGVDIGVLLLFLLVLTGLNVRGMRRYRKV
ncbi:ABC transporter permease [Lacticaseibacillus jixianensis]|uniref:ABC transporter permease n=1 Tax=Lacticaseibacillus jixianensis TaxID=2486012 RepID=A0ABW4B5U9_9LACO|nr:ABC transporter permease [Lacticaseibacillus jixianensis]